MSSHSTACAAGNLDMLFPLVTDPSVPQPCEEEAHDEERRIRRRYRLPWVALWHRSMFRRSAFVLNRLPDRGAAVRAAVAQSRTTLRAYKVVLLSQLMRQTNATTVLELGGGASTFLLAQILAERNRATGSRCRLISLEQSPDYVGRINAAMPTALSRFVEVIYSPVSVREVSGFRALFYDRLPALAEIDFIFIDGPAPDVDGRTDNLFSFSGDLVLMARRGVRFQLAATDVRWLNKTLFERALGTSGYEVAADVLKRSVLVRPKATG
jgi:hypothetical protein